MELTHAWRGAGVPLCSTVTCVRWYSALVLCKRSMRGPWGAGSCWYEFRGNCDWLQARVLTSLHTLAHRLAGLGPLWDVSDTFPFSSKTQPIILFSIYFKSSDLRQIFLSSVFRENCEVWSVNPAPPPGPQTEQIFFVCVVQSGKYVASFVFIFCSSHMPLWICLLATCDVKAIPMQAWIGPLGCRRLRLLKFLDIRHMKVARLSALHTGRLYPAGDDIRGTHFR